MKILKISLCFITAWNIYGAYSRLAGVNPEMPAYSIYLNIDAPLYVNFGRLMARARTFYPLDYDHSVGMQTLTALVFRLRGGEAILPVKLTLFVGWLGAIALLALAFAKITKSEIWGFAAAAFFSSSEWLSAYSAIVQLEIPLALLAALILYLNVRPVNPSRAFLTGLAVALSATFRVTYVLSVPALAVYFAVRPGKARAVRVGAFLGGFLLWAVPWNVVHSYRLHGIYFFQEIMAHTFRRYMNPNAQPFNFPFTEPTPPYGWEFVVTYPAKYLALLGDRLLYLVGYYQDTWLVESRWTIALHDRFSVPWEIARKYVACAGVALFVGGLATRLRSRAADGWLTIIFSGVVAVQHLLIGSSTRFLIPVYPFILLTQLCGVRAAGQWLGQGLASTVASEKGAEGAG